MPEETAADSGASTLTGTKASTSQPPADMPTAILWQRRSVRSPAIVSAVALTGVDVTTLTDATSIALAASDEARALLDGMEVRIRTMPTTVATSSERCVSSVRGPIMWSETLTARANALGNDDVFVCMTTSRSFDTVENRLLVDALGSIAGANRALSGPTGERVQPEEAERIATIATEAAAWRADSRFSGVTTRRLTGRAAARVRGGHRKAWMEPILAVRRRAREPFVPADVVGLCDEWTAALHRTLLQVLEALERPHVLTLSDGGLWCGDVSFRHPQAPGSGTSGLALRGRPVLPEAKAIEDGPWAHLLPTGGVRVPVDAGPDEVRTLLRHSSS